MKTIVLGPPGTGKTHTLLNKVDDYLKTTNPDRIGYFAFTKKAANEAKDRAMKKFNLSDDDLPYFRTLHSLAFRSLGIKKNQVICLEIFDEYRSKSARVNSQNRKKFCCSDRDYFRSRPWIRCERLGWHNRLFIRASTDRGGVRSRGVCRGVYQ